MNDIVILSTWRETLLWIHARLHAMLLSIGKVHVVHCLLLGHVVLPGGILYHCHLSFLVSHALQSHLSLIFQVFSFFLSHLIKFISHLNLSLSLRLFSFPPASLSLLLTEGIKSSPGVSHLGQLVL